MAVPPQFQKGYKKKPGTADDKKAAIKGKGEIPNTPGNRSLIVDKIEAKKGPVGPGHHNSHRTAHISEWLAMKGKKK